ncbi:MAG: cell division protein FtsX [Bdellovibrionales bacterium]
MAGLKQWALAFSTGLTLSSCLFLSMMLFVFAKSLHQAAVDAEKSVVLEVFLKGEVGEEARLWTQNIQKNFEIQEIEYLDKSEAEKNFITLMRDDWGEVSTDRAILDIVPSSIIIKFQSGLAHERIQMMAQEIIENAKSLINFESAHFQSDWAAWFSDYRVLASQLAFGFFSLIGILIYFVISNLNRSLIGRFSQLIEVKYLVGATHWQVVRPFLLLSGLIGAGAFIVAGVLNEWGVSRLQSLLLPMGQLIPDSLVTSLSTTEYLTCLMFVITICLISSDRCVREHNL